MNRLTITLLCLTVLKMESYCQDSPKLSVNLKLIKEYFVPYDYSKRLSYEPERKDSLQEKTFDVEISIKNNSDSTISIWLMSCSWDENFLINNSYIFFKLWDCNKNIPTIHEIKAHDSLILKRPFTRAIMWDNPCKGCIGQISEVATTKIGLVYIDEKRCHNFADYENIMGDKSTWGKIIWSNPLYLDK